MYYSNLIKIKYSESVIEIGPGSAPFWRSDILIDKYDETDIVPAGNFGGGSLNIAGKPFFKIINNKIPFEDNSFDVAIISHVLEHVPANEMSALISEVFRIAGRVYIEFPAPLYEYLFDIPAHLNLLDMDGNYIYCLPKDRALSFKNSLVMYIRKLNEKQNLKLGRTSKQYFTKGKWYDENPPPLIFFDSEVDFLNNISLKSYYPPVPSFPSKVLNKIRALSWPIFNMLRKQKIANLISKNFKY